MLAPWLVERVKTLSAEGRSQREIARQLPVSRGSVHAIVTGKRPDYEALKAARQRQAALTQLGDGPPVRCPGCGGKVILPCLVCLLRRLRDSGTSPRKYLDLGSDPTFKLDLKPDDRARYEQIQKEKGPDREAQSPTPHPQSRDNDDPLPERDFAQVWELAGAERDQMGRELFIEESDCDQRPPTADELREAMGNADC